MKKIFYITSLLIILSSFNFANAQESKSYYYKYFDVNINVEKDSSFTVEERQLYSYKGNYNKGYRNIPLNGMSDITDIVVVDGQTGLPLNYSPKVLDKLNPSSWGSYTSYKKDGQMIVEWYYNITDSDHLWILKYKVYGGIGFYKDHDEVYWNIFTQYEVPVASSTVYVNLPPNSFLPSDFSATAYTTGAHNNPHKWYRDSDQMFGYFTAGPFLPQDDFTISLGWPKGLLHASDFWKYWLLKNAPYILSILIILGTILYLYLYWLFTEKLKKGRGTIIAEYTPPHNLPPAMAEIIVTEKNTPRAWSATIVDLAVKGYVKIEKEENQLEGYKGAIVKLIIMLPFVLFAFILFLNLHSSNFVYVALVPILIVIFAIFSKSTDYKITKLKEFENDKILHDYEKEFLKILFNSGESFSTKKMKNADPSVKRRMYLGMVDLKENLSKEVGLDEVSSYDVNLSYESKFNSIYFLPPVYIFVGILILAFLGSIAPYILMVLVILWSVNTIYYFIKYNPRLSSEGRIFKEEWLGFKLYLETAEKYRMQNLTPEIFEKYLPYAMIFSVEKKWAKAFDFIVKTEPAWYGHSSSVHTGVGVSAGLSNFSASTFSSSFSSSFSSAFTSAGAGGGGSGGGGSAGGGGGGGGGGAS